MPGTLPRGEGAIAGMSRNVGVMPPVCRASLTVRPTANRQGPGARPRDRKTRLFTASVVRSVDGVGATLETAAGPRVAVRDRRDAGRHAAQVGVAQADERLGVEGELLPARVR